MTRCCSPPRRSVFRDKIVDLFGHDGKSAPGGPGAGGLDLGVNGKDVHLAGDASPPDRSTSAHRAAFQPHRQHATFQRRTPRSERSVVSKLSIVAQDLIDHEVCHRRLRCRSARWSSPLPPSPQRFGLPPKANLGPRCAGHSKRINLSACCPASISSSSARHLDNLGTKAQGVTGAPARSSSLAEAFSGGIARLRSAGKRHVRARSIRWICAV